LVSTGGEAKTEEEQQEGDTTELLKEKFEEEMRKLAAEEEPEPTGPTANTMDKLLAEEGPDPEAGKRQGLVLPVGNYLISPESSFYSFQHFPFIFLVRNNQIR
jgi:hypothetical protein